MEKTLVYDAWQGFFTVFIAWIFAQTIKIIIGVIREKRFNFRWLVTTGGMPSTHSAAVAALATVVGVHYGFGSVIFAITCTFTLITMFDAAGVRRNVGKQASLLNQMMDDIYETGEVPEKRLKELLGHTPVEVFAGATVGVIVAVLMYR